MRTRYIAIRLHLLLVGNAEYLERAYPETPQDICTRGIRLIESRASQASVVIQERRPDMTMPSDGWTWQGQAAMDGFRFNVVGIVVVFFCVLGSVCAREAAVKGRGWVLAGDCMGPGNPGFDVVKSRLIFGLLWTCAGEMAGFSSIFLVSSRGICR